MKTGLNTKQIKYPIVRQRMRWIFLLLVCCRLDVQAQSMDTTEGMISMPFVFAEGTIGHAHGIMSGIGGNMIFANEWGLNIGYNQIDRNSANVPADYDPGLCILSCATPTDELYTYTFRISKGFETRTQLIRFKAEAGLAWGQYQQVRFTPVHSTGWLDLGSNYSLSYSKHATRGLSLRAAAEFPFSQITGLQVAVSCIVSNYQSYAGIEAGMTLGYIRERLKGRKKK